MALTRLERGLRLFTDVREGEGPTALVMFANVFLILCAYYFIKPLREGWIAVSGVSGLSSMEVKAYTSFGQTLLLIPLVWTYGRLSSEWDREQLVRRATLFFMSNMVVFWLLQPDFFWENLPYTGVVFYLWVGMFGVFVVAQFFAFAADIYADERGDRLLPLIALGATSGAAFGSMVIGPLVKSGLIQTEWLLVIALVPLGISIFLTRAADRAEPRVVPAGAEGPPPDSGRSAFGVVFSSRFLVAVAAITMLLNWVNTNGENLLFGKLQEFLATDAVKVGASDIELFKKQETTLFYASFFTWVNIIALLLQGFVASRVLKYGGFGVLLLMLPVVSLVSYSAMALVPVLAIVKTMKIAENATDYSINNTARHVLWVPVSAEMKYKGKPTIDSLFARLGDGLAALTILVGVQLLALPTELFFVFNVSLVVVWLLAALVVVRGHGRLSREEPSNAVA